MRIGQQDREQKIGGADAQEGGEGLCRFLDRPRHRAAHRRPSQSPARATKNIQTRDFGCIIDSSMGKANTYPL